MDTAEWRGNRACGGDTGHTGGGALVTAPWKDTPSLPVPVPVPSAGVGRTGCFIVIDAMLERIKHEKTVDIYGHVTLMRSQRNYMVQTEDQYSFIHDALLEAVACGNTEVPARNLYSYIQKLAQIEAREHVTGMELEFKVSPGAGMGQQGLVNTQSLCQAAGTSLLPSGR